MVNYWRAYIISLVMYFSELPKHKIWQVNFDKLLEMLSRFGKSFSKTAKYHVG